MRGLQGAMFSVGQHCPAQQLCWAVVSLLLSNQIPKEDLMLCKPQSMIDEFHNCRFIQILIRNLIKDNLAVGNLNCGQGWSENV